ADAAGRPCRAAASRCGDGRAAGSDRAARAEREEARAVVLAGDPRTRRRRRRAWFSRVAPRQGVRGGRLSIRAAAARPAPLPATGSRDEGSLRAVREVATA